MQLLISLSVVVGLALVASSKFFWSLRRTAVGAVIFSGGWVAVALGLLLSWDRLGLVAAAQVNTLEPLVHFVLGWVGVMVGLQLRRDLPKLLPMALLRLMALDLLLALLVAGIVWLAIGRWLDVPDDQPLRWFIAAFLGICMIGWAAEVRYLRRQSAGDTQTENLVRAASGLSSVYTLVMYGLLFFLFTTTVSGVDTSMTIDARGLLLGLLFTILIALASGLLSHWLMGLAGRNEGHFLVVLLGVVALISGTAEALGEPPLLVGMLSGAVIVNLPGEQSTRLKRVLLEAEQPMAMAIMLVAGLLAEPLLPPLAWWMVGGLVVSRLVLKWGVIGRRIARATPTGPPALFHLAPIRQHPLALAMAVGLVLTHPIDHRQLTGPHLLMVVILVGFGCDLLTLMGRWRGRTNGEKDNGAMLG